MTTHTFAQGATKKVAMQTYVHSARQVWARGRGWTTGIVKNTTGSKQPPASPLLLQAVLEAAAARVVVVVGVRRVRQG